MMNQIVRKKPFFLLLLLFASHSAYSATLSGIPEFIDEMVAKHQFKRVELESAFDNAQYLPKVIEAISRPPTIRPWMEYRASFVNPERIRRGLDFWQKYQNVLQGAEQKYGVPQEIILGVIGVETVYGRDVGSFRTLDALTTLAFDYPKRAPFFRDELENYLLLAREQQFDLLSIKGSYAGALGIAQFMPSSYRNYAVDFNGDRRIDLLNETRDAIGSVANYLKAYGWIGGGNNKSVLPIAVKVKVSERGRLGDISTPRAVAAWLEAGVVPDENLDQMRNESARLADFTVEGGKEYWLAFKNFEVITKYNNSDYYAMSVFQLAQAVKEARDSSTIKKSGAVAKSGSGK